MGGKKESGEIKMRFYKCVECDEIVTDQFVGAVIKRPDGSVTHAKCGNTVEDVTKTMTRYDVRAALGYD